MTVYGADWCGYTKKIQKEVLHDKDMMQKFKDIDCKVEYVECSKDASACDTLNITGFPTIEIMVDGKKTMVAGYKPGNDILDMIKKM